MGVSALSRAVSVGVSLLLAVVALAVTAAPAEAAVVPPWRWKYVYLQNQSVAATSAGFFELSCPAGYIPVSGGMRSNNNALWLMREYPDYNTNKYVVVVWNWTPTTRPLDVVGWCANADDVGPIVIHNEQFQEVNNRAGGYSVCPDGTSLISGGVDWNSFGDRHIDYSGPTALADAWYAAGTSAATNDILNVEVRCIDSARMPDWTPVTSSVDISGSNTGSRNVTCPEGKRVLTGGTWAGPSGTNIRDSASRGGLWASYPSFDSRSWTGQAQVVDSRFGVIALCIPVSIPEVNITQTPPSLTTSNSGTFTFTASDPAGEELSYGCTVGNVQVACSPGSVISFGPLTDGLKTLSVTAVNTSGRSTNKQYQFTIDTTPPSVATRDPATVASLTGDFTMDFSEPVTGVNGSTLRVFADGSSSPLAGTVTTQPPGNAATFARFRPAAPLMPGQTYSVQFADGVEDLAGLPLTKPDWEVRANTVVDDESPVVKASWDSDKSAKASRGRYITSRDKGAQAGLTFVAPSSGEVSLFGIRTPKGGYGLVYVDGVFQRKVSFYGLALKRARVFRATGLKSAVQHTIRVEVAGAKPKASRGTWVALDALAIGTKTKQESDMQQTFRSNAGATAYGGAFSSVTHATRDDNGGRPAYRMRFRGTSISLHATLGPEFGKAAVYVDGVLEKKINLTAVARAYDIDVFSKALSDKVHEIRVEALGTRSGSKSAVVVDRFVIG